MLALDLDCLVAVLPWIWFAFLGFFGFLRDVSFGFGLLLDFLDWIWIFFGSDWIGNPKVELGARSAEHSVHGVYIPSWQLFPR